MRIIIATTQLPLVQGGAEFQAEGLAAALVAAGHDVDTVRIPGLPPYYVPLVKLEV